MRKVIERLKKTLWLLPSIIVIACILTAIGLLEVDLQLQGSELLNDWPWLFDAGAQGARQVLATIASSVITVGGVVFSITVVVLSLASSQYSPRVLRNFISDWPSQIVLGGFLGIFAYCLLILRTVRGSDHDVFVPSISILGSLILALAGIGLLIFFIHHIADSIRATSIVTSVFKETSRAIDDLYPDVIDTSRMNENELEKKLKQETKKDFVSFRKIRSRSTGYVQAIDISNLIKIAKEHQGSIRTEKSVGEFVIEGSPIAFVEEKIPSQIEESILSSIRVGFERTFEQDVGFGIGQLVDVALKGLSPGINDVTTSLICIDYLSALFCRLVNRKMESATDVSEIEVQLFLQRTAFRSLLDQAFGAVRKAGENDPSVLIRLLRGLQEMLMMAQDRDRADCIIKQIELIGATFRAQFSKIDLEKVEQVFSEISQVVDEKRRSFLTPSDRELSVRFKNDGFDLID